jgi:hypothetical protein
MIKQPTLIRDRIIRHLHELRMQISQLPEFEHDALMALGGVPYEDPEALTATANILLERLGIEPATVRDPRFDKTRRQLGKASKPPRGANTFDSGKDRKKAAAARGIPTALPEAT